MRIVIATDAWAPQVNGVVTTLTQTREELVAQGHEVLLITPEGRRTLPCPTYPEIRLTFLQGRQIAREIDAFKPDCIHIATEATIGLSVRRYCLRRNLSFTTAYHTQFPEYVRARFPIPVRWTVALLRWFHAPATRTMVPTPAIKTLLESRGFSDVVIWSRGVNTHVFVHDQPFHYELPKPVWIYVGRVAVEKNIEDFLALDLPGSRIVIGDGPVRERLAVKYPDCRFLGYRFGSELASFLAGADVFVFPSRTDTFGIVMLEAMACGLPVAAYPVTGPVDVVQHGVTGILNVELQRACLEALELDRTVCRKYAESRSWTTAANQFKTHLVVRSGADAVSTPALARTTRR